MIWLSYGQLIQGSLDVLLVLDETMQGPAENKKYCIYYVTIKNPTQCFVLLSLLMPTKLQFYV